MKPPTVQEGFYDEIWGHHGYGCSFEVRYSLKIHEPYMSFGPAACGGACLDDHADQGCFPCSKRYLMVIKDYQTTLNEIYNLLNSMCDWYLKDPRGVIVI